MPTEDVELEDLREQFQEIVGFVKRPTTEDPSPCNFAALVGNSISQPAKGKFKESFWIVMTALRDQDKAVIVDADGDEHAMKAGTSFGLSGSGALKGLREKKGYLAVISFTGKKIPSKNGDMWEAHVKVSKKPIDDSYKLAKGVNVKLPKAGAADAATPF